MEKAPRNRTLTITQDEINDLSRQIIDKEKLIAKPILASSKKGDIVFDPFLGSGTTSVVAKKLGRRYCGVEINTEYCCWAEKRLKMADTDTSIQGYSDGVFWERNTLNQQKNSSPKVKVQQQSVQKCSMTRKSQK